MTSLFDAFGAQEIRDVVKCRAHLIEIAGFPPSHVIIITLTQIRDHYISRVGMPTYLSQMLGDVVKIPIRMCRLIWEDGNTFDGKLELEHPNMVVQRFIRKYYRIHNLPYKVIYGLTTDVEQVKYL
jgi:hypothetical protein